MTSDEELADLRARLAATEAHVEWLERHAVLPELAQHHQCVALATRLRALPVHAMVPDGRCMIDANDVRALIDELGKATAPMIDEDEDVADLRKRLAAAEQERDTTLRAERAAHTQTKAKLAAVCDDNTDLRARLAAAEREAKEWQDRFGRTVRRWICRTCICWLGRLERER